MSNIDNAVSLSKRSENTTGGRLFSLAVLAARLRGWKGPSVVVPGGETLVPWQQSRTTTSNNSDWINTQDDLILKNNILF